MIKYVAEYKYGSPALYSVEIEKETEKTYMIVSSKTTKIYGWGYFPHRLNKDTYHVFDSIPEAIAYFRKSHESYVEHHLKDISDSNLKMEEAESKIADYVVKHD